MNRFGLLLAAAWLAMATTGRAAGIGDSVRTVDQNKWDGRIVRLSPTEVTIEQLAATEKVPVNQIESVSFAEDPAVLKSARSHVLRGDFEAAAKVLATAKPESIERVEIRQDLEYYQAYCAARLALGGNGDIGAAGKQLRAFVTAYPETYHYFEACETLGDLLVAKRQYPIARQYYEQVSKAPWPDYKARAAISVGQACLAENKPAEAQKFFEFVLEMKGESDLFKAQRQAAILGKARCLGEANPETAVKAIETVIASTDPEDSSLLAQAYNALGYTHRKAGRAQEAIFAYLHVDALYSSHAEAHAEALYYLTQLFRETGKQGRAKETETQLKDQYADSQWSQQVQGKDKEKEMPVN